MWTLSRSGGQRYLKGLSQGSLRFSLAFHRLELGRYSSHVINTEEERLAWRPEADALSGVEKKSSGHLSRTWLGVGLADTINPRPTLLGYGPDSAPFWGSFWRSLALLCVLFARRDCGDSLKR